ncbi:N-6 DNA methylase [Helicobacter sp. 13S00401-1]|uniref:N-6 DNA methylase n=1 Tax=Helicobacter sp. 13S00401-1 TaxID=1905758 RepID=UPI000BA6A561|nr:N-6 DNA methylase [Helicobacter sp. 13S00401-1]
MKKLIDCFDYMKRYHSDILDALSIMLELFLLKKQEPSIITDLIDKAHKRQPIKQIFKELLSQKSNIQVNLNVNILKILKVINTTDVTPETIESFLNIISQKKTTNKLYYYSTPKEVNHLLCLLLELKEDESLYNPCYGIGSIFLSIASIMSSKNIKLFGEELDLRFSAIAKLIAKLSDIDEANLIVNDILKRTAFKKDGEIIKFDKVICNPPLYAHMGIEQLKEDERFSKIGILVKNYPELVFLTHALSHLKTRGVFIVRNQTLLKQGLESKLREKLLKEKMIEAVIELPKNIFPHQGYDFSILVISYNNNLVKHIDASSFYVKDGKYNKLVDIDKIVSMFSSNANSEFSKVTELSKLYVDDLRASHHVHTTKLTKQTLLLKDLDLEIFRGQRVHDIVDSTHKIKYFDLGIADFAQFGFSDKFSNEKESSEIAKILKYSLRPYDLLLSLRGVMPKVTILSPNLEETLAIANAGIIILRFQNKEDALALYCYLFSKKGYVALSHIYENSAENIVSANDLLNLVLPKNFHNYASKMQDIEELKEEYLRLDAKVLKLKEEL